MDLGRGRERHQPHLKRGSYRLGSSERRTGLGHWEAVLVQGTDFGK